MNPTTDPWDWTVDQVVTHLCDDGELYERAGFFQSDRPERRNFEAQIRKERIAGRALLCRVDEDFMRINLRVISARQRSALVKVILQLQLRSANYRRLYPNGSAHRTTRLDTQSPQVPFGKAQAENRPHYQQAVQGKTVKKAINLTTTALPSAMAMTSVPEPPQMRADSNDAGPSNMENGGEGDDWGYLMDRWKEDDEEIAFEAIGDEEELDDIDDETTVDGPTTETDIQEPIQSEQGKNGKLSIDEVAGIINSFIKEYTNTWFPGRDRKEDEEYLTYDSFELWNDFHEAPDDEKQRVLEETRMNIKWFENQIDRLCEAIATHNEGWASEAAIRYQCKSLQLPIDNLEHEKWELDIYKRKLPPAQGFHEIHTPATTMATPSVTRQGDFDEEYIVDRGVSPLTSSRVNATATLNTNPKAIEIIDLGSGTDTETETEADAMDVDENIQPPQPAAEASHPTQQSIETTVVGPAPTLESSPQPEPADVMIMDTVEVDSILGPSQTPAPSASQTPSQPPSESRHRPHPHWQQDSQQPSQSQVHTLPLMTLPVTRPLPSIHPHDPPTAASYSTITKWTWPDLVHAKDRKRIVMKVIQEMAAPDREALRARLTTVRRSNLVLEISQCITMRLAHSTHIPGFRGIHMENIVKLTDLFLCWWLADNYYVGNKGKVATEERLKELKQCMRQGVRDPEIFCDWARWVMENTFSAEALQRLWDPSQAEIIVISDDEDTSPGPQRTPKTPRKPRDATPRDPRKRAQVVRRGTNRRI